jgi:hypothetical protein
MTEDTVNVRCMIDGVDTAVELLRPVRSPIWEGLT